MGAARHTQRAQGMDGGTLTPWLDDGDVRLYHGDAIETLAALPAESVDCCITSPPYYGLRDYGVDGQIGLEDTPEAFIARLVDVFRGVRRVLRPEGTCWVNLGDSYTGSANSGGDNGNDGGPAVRVVGLPAKSGAKPKDLLMMPARLALALQADGWYLRADIIWHKPNPMPESVTDRPTSAHEHIFLLTKQPRYWYDAEAIKECSDWGRVNNPQWQKQRAETNARKGAGNRNAQDGGFTAWQPENGRNARNVWTIATQPTPEAHFATYPEELVRRCLVAGCPEQVCRECGEPRLGWSDCGHDAYRPGIVLDPFMGSGTTARVARHHGRHAVGIELNEDYLRIAAHRLRQLSLMGGAA